MVVIAVTNTNDFRRYSYLSDTSYLIDSFSYTSTSQAPKLRPDAEPDRGLKVRENKKIKSKGELKAEQKSALAKAVKIAAVSVISFVMVVLVIHSYAQKNELTRSIESTQTQIENANSEYISLQSRLDSLVSMRMIDKYAVEELGMTKVKSNQIQYINVNDYKAQRKDS